MAKLSLYLDQRRGHEDDASIKLRININGQVSFYNTGIDIAPKYWDASAMSVIKHRFADCYNEQLDEIFRCAHDILLQLTREERIASMRADDLRDMLKERLDHSDQPDQSLLLPGYLETMDTKTGRNREIYETALKRILEFVTEYKYVIDEKSIVGLSHDQKNDLRQQAREQTLADSRVRNLRYDDVDVKWLQRLDAKLSINSPSKNSRSIVFRCLRHVFKNAVLFGYTKNNPFSVYKIQRQETTHRDLPTPELRDFMNYKCDEHQQFFLDMFRLTFFLIGINTADLCTLKNITPGGRVEFSRHKTHRPYSIKVEPEALTIINRWKGQKYLLCCLDRYKSSKNFMLYCNRHLQQIGPYEWTTSTGRNHLPMKQVNPLQPKITTYVARHSWASIAAELDIPKEVISAALGHSMGSRTTSIYINYDRDKVDIANRLVIDWVLYHKYTSWYVAMENHRKCREQERVEASQVHSIVESKAV